MALSEGGALSQAAAANANVSCICCLAAQTPTLKHRFIQQFVAAARAKTTHVRMSSPFCDNLNNTISNCSRSQNNCTPRVVMESRSDFRLSTCCDHSKPNHLWNNCCCTAYWHVATDQTMAIRNGTFIALVFFYGFAILVMCYNICDSYRVSTRAKRTKYITDFLKSRKFVSFVVTMIATTVGICAAVNHKETFDCMGGQGVSQCDSNELKQPYGTTLLVDFLVYDAVANIFFIISKIMILQNCLHTAQLGCYHLKAREGPSIRLLLATAMLLGVSCVCWFVIVVVHAVYGMSYASDLLRNETAPIQEDTVKERRVLRLYLYMFGALSLSIASLCAFLYIRHTKFHLRRYLLPHTPTPPAAKASALSDSWVMKRGMGQVIRGNFRRLQVSTALIAFSVVVKAVPYLLLSISSAWQNDTRYCDGGALEAPDYSNRSNFFLQQYCDYDYQFPVSVFARTVLGSPLVYPLIALFMDPLMMMCVNLKTIHNRNRHLVSPANTFTTDASNSIFSIVTYLTSGIKNKQNDDAKIDITRARVVSRRSGSFVDIFSSGSDFAASLMQPEDREHQRDAQHPI